MNLDPRPGVVERRLAAVERVIAVTGGKGGIGKSMVSSCLAATLARQGKDTGLLDLDLTGPCDHLILGVDTPFPEEEYGLVPPLADGVRFMSVSYFTGPEAVPLRGADVSNAVIELLTIVQWGALDYLVIDMPPGLGDALLDIVRLLHRSEFLVVATSSRVVIQTVQRTLHLLNQVQVPVLGIVENMQRAATPAVFQLARELGVPFWGSLPFDDSLEEATGQAAALVQTRFGRALADMTRRQLLNSPPLP